MSRPILDRQLTSVQLVDLHIYVVPPDIWRRKHNDVLNTDVNETISAGFIRVHPENKVFTLRDDIEQQLGLDLTPKDYVFMKCVGRSLTRVKPKQEYQLKIKNFLPPLAYLPEVYLLEVSPGERHLYGLSSGEGSSRAQTRTSVHLGDTPHPHGYRNRYSEEDLDRYNSRERLNLENEKIRNGGYHPDTARSRQDSTSLPPISNQLRSPPPHNRTRSPPDDSPTGRSNRHRRETEEGSQPPLSASPPPSPDKHRSNQSKRGYNIKAYPEGHQPDPRRTDSPDGAYSGNTYGDRGQRTYRAADSDAEGKARQREQENAQLREEERRQREDERRRQEEQLRQWEDERRETLKRLEDERRDRERDNQLERQQLLADQEMLDLLDNARRQEEQQRRRRQEEEDLQRQRDEEEEEAYRRHKQEEEEEYRRREEEQAALQRQQEEADRRRIEEQRQRLQNDELLKADTDEQTEEELSRFPSPPPIHTTSPDRELSEEDKARKKAEKERLQSELDKAREQRRAVERQREELVKRAKLLQTKTQNRRNHARDVWKKRYFEEKKKTSPLEDQCNRLRQEVEQIHRKLMSTLEGPKDHKGGKISNNIPSEKNNFKIQATKLQHEIEDLKRRAENAKMKLTAEMKLRNQAETELRALRAELTQKKINLTLSRSQQMATLSASNNDMAYMTPRPMVSPRS
ncbi:spermatogenesis-associated protein 1-like isoform X2 [Liolophura sinensis]|uniref:spermatogenesis-associated protein 1-like isoform X2 n=1 Tax=Liolophura sinensis TaxID=3198878 RepID=UPI003158711E